MVGEAFLLLASKMTLGTYEASVGSSFVYQKEIYEFLSHENWGFPPPSCPLSHQSGRS